MDLETVQRVDSWNCFHPPDHHQVEKLPVGHRQAEDQDHFRAHNLHFWKSRLQDSEIAMETE